MHCGIFHFKAVAVFRQTHIAVCMSNGQVWSWGLSDFQQVYEPLQGGSLKELTKLGFSSQLKMIQLSTESGLPHNTDTRKENGTLFVKGNKKVDQYSLFLVQSVN